MDVEQLPYPWERRDKESDQAWQAFQIYRDMPIGDASMRGVARQLGKSEALIFRWSSRWEWVERRQAWELEQDRRRQDAMANEQVDMAKRHATNAAAYMRTLLAPAEELIARMRQGGKLNLSQLSEAELIRLMVSCARVFPTIMAAERIARGQTHGSTALLRPTTGMDGAVMTNAEQLAEVYAALEEAGLAPGRETYGDADDR